jgi:acetate kinase
MGTRAGSVDPGALLYLLRTGVSAAELDDALEHESGLLALAGTADVRELERAAAPEAEAALELLCYRVAQAVGALAVSLGGLDAIAFTAGIGEHSARVRADVCEQLEFLGVALDAHANETLDSEGEIGAPDARVRVHVVHAREDVVVARAVRDLLAAG